MNRTKLECCMSILDASRYVHIPRYIFAESGVGSDVGKQYLSILVEYGYVSKIKYTPIRYKYYITETGKEVLIEYKNIIKLFKGLNTVRKTKKRMPKK